MTGSFAGLVGSLKKAGVALPTNYITNGTFESATMSQWYTQGDATTMTRSTSYAHSGTYSGQFVFDGVNGTMSAGYSGAGVSGGRFSFSVWFLTTNITYNAINYTVDLGGNGFSGMWTLPSINTWYKFTYSNVLPGGANYLNLDFQMVGFPSSGNFYIDDVYVVSGATPF